MRDHPGTPGAVCKFFFSFLFFLKKKKKKKREEKGDKVVTIRSPNITKMYASVNLFLSIGFYMYNIPKIVTDPL